ncbi:MAG: ferric-dicitrate binding protein FerR (iron transport regulator) [Lentisphaeria bacterium]|jgi:ferric-dicitrate binding protein FerR (iron transport regulator)
MTISVKSDSVLRDEIEEQASYWFTEIIVDEASHELQVEFSLWLNVSPLHREIYEEIENIWGALAALPEDAYEGKPLSISDTENKNKNESDGENRGAHH